MQRRVGLTLLSPAALVAAAVLAAACSVGSDDAAPTTNGSVQTESSTAEPASTASTPTESSTEPPTSDDTEPSAQPSLSERLPVVESDFEIVPGVEQIAIVGAEPGTMMAITTATTTTTTTTTTTAATALPAGDEVDPLRSGIVDDYGSLLFRNLDADEDWVLVVEDREITDPIDVVGRDEHPDAAFYAEQQLGPGLNYIEMSDGTLLAANVVLPGPIEDGPYPTVVEYSGYTPADPNADGFKDLFIPLGYAYVGVNMRGTGCSGGSFSYFEYTQSTDGYDVIESVAAQPWVFDKRVGMVGVSYPGISQLFVAQTQPPSLAAITPFSVIDDSYDSTLYPGGILNTGFAVEWSHDRVDNGRPAIDPDGNITTDGGQDWARNRIELGDETCAANQSLRLQNPDLVTEIFESPFTDSRDDTADLSPRLFVDKITVPTFVAGAWQDEQTGGRFPTMLDRFTGTDHLYATLVNGLHTESIGPANFARWVEFLDLYVAKRVPTLDTARFVAPVLAAGIFGTDDFELPADRFAGATYDDALADFESEPPIRVLFEEGAGNDTARAPVPRFVEAFEAWPIPSVEPTEWWLGQDGALLDTVESDNGRAAYLALPDGIAPTFYEGNSSNIWRTDVEWDWQEPAPGTAADFITSPLESTTTMIGSGSADLWVNSNLGDTDLEVTLSEVRPDGQEMYVQSGWLRASHRRLDDQLSTPLQPVHTHREADAEPLSGAAGESDFDLARIEIFPFAHVFRAGSRIRLSVDAPGGNRPVWIFDTISGGEQVQIGLGGDFPSKVVLPVVPGIEPPADYPACGALRGQPCRTFTG